MSRRLRDNVGRWARNSATYNFYFGNRRGFRYQENHFTEIENYGHGSHWANIYIFNVNTENYYGNLNGNRYFNDNNSRPLKSRQRHRRNRRRLHRNMDYQGSAEIRPINEYENSGHSVGVGVEDANSVHVQINDSEDWDSNDESSMSDYEVVTNHEG